jgi:hypothetical protein
MGRSHATETFWEFLASSVVPKGAIVKPNWNTHFRNLSRTTSGQAEFGTVGGLYTIAELKDLLNAKDSDMANLSTMANQFFATWQKQNPNAANAWHNDWQALIGRYASAKSSAQTIASSNYFLPDNMTPADGPYRDVLTALNPAWQTNGSAPGSLSDLSQRIALAGASTAGLAPTPQPGQKSDVDLNTFNKVNQATPYIPAAVKAAVGALAPNIVPTDKSKPEFDPASFVKDHWEGLTIGGVGLLVTLKVLAKFGL